MKAVLYDRFGPPDVLHIRSIPLPMVHRGEVLVRIIAASVNPIDTLLRRGHFRWLGGRRFPKRTGVDFCGTVAELGAGVSGLRPHDAVYGMLDPMKGATCAEYAVVPVEQLALKPETMPFLDAAALPLTALTALQALSNIAHLQRDQHVLIHGASGGVGTAAVQIAKALGARVTASCSAAALELVTGLGADVVFDYRQTPPTAVAGNYHCIFDIHGDLCIDAVRHLLMPGGAFVTTVPSRRILIDRFRTIVPLGTRARFVSVRPNARDLQLVADWVDGGLLRPVIANIYPLAGIADAHRQLETQHTHGKLIISVLA